MEQKLFFKRESWIIGEIFSFVAYVTLLHKFLYEYDDASVQVHQNEAKAAITIKKNIQGAHKSTKGKRQ